MGQISADAWRIFRCGAFGYVTLGEAQALRAFQALAETAPLEVGETGAAAFAGVLAATHDSAIRQQLQIDETSRVSFIATEGVTDREVYRRLLRSAQASSS